MEFRLLPMLGPAGATTADANDETLVVLPKRTDESLPLGTRGDLGPLAEPLPSTRPPGGVVLFVIVIDGPNSLPPDRRRRLPGFGAETRDPETTLSAGGEPLHIDIINVVNVGINNVFGGVFVSLWEHFREFNYDGAPHSLRNSL